MAKLKPSEFEIPPDNPFANDKLNRKECADALTNLVTNNPGPLVMSINGGWGTGKTVFLRMWDQSLKNDKFTRFILVPGKMTTVTMLLSLLLDRYGIISKIQTSKKLPRPLKNVPLPYLEILFSIP